MIRILYTSKADEKLPYSEVKNIHDYSRKNNEKIGITGVLVHSKGMFLQILEGKEEIINPLIEKISHDPRNHDLELQCVWEIETRCFSNWSMGLIGYEPTQDTEEFIRNMSDLMNKLGHEKQEIRLIKSCLKIMEKKPLPISEQKLLKKKPV